MTRRQPSLRAQLAIAAAVLALIVIALAGAVIAIRMDNRDRSEVDAQLAARAERVGVDLDKMLPGGHPSSDSPSEKAAAPDDSYGDLLDGSQSLVRLISGSQIVAQRGAAPTRPLPAPTSDGYSDVTIDGAPWRSYVSTTTDDEQALVKLQVLQSLQPVQDRLTANARLIAFVTIAAALVAAAAGWLIGRAVLRPLGRLATGAAAIQHNPDPTHRLPSVSHPHEVAALSNTLNGMLDRLGAGTETIRRFTADVGHELRTPLAATGAYLETLQADPTVSGPARESVNAMTTQQHRMLALIEGLQALARAEAGAFPGDTEVEIGTLVGELTRMARRRHLGVSYDFTDTSDGASITGWRDGLRIAVDNLLDNAAHHGRPHGHVRVTVELDHPDTATVTTRKDHHERIRVTIADDGPSIPQELRDTLRQRFTSGPQNRSRGSGLGLALVEQQAHLHGGTLSLDTSDEGGLAATITITNATNQPSGAAVPQQVLEE